MSLISDQQIYSNDRPLLRIVGGNDVKPPFKYPSIVAIMNRGEEMCGGTLYNENTIITAAHCFTDAISISNLSVHIHRHNLTKYDFEENGKSYKVISITNHPDYDYDTDENDISIWKIDVSRKNNKPLIDLDDGRYSSKNGQMAIAIGWGFMDEENMEDSPILQQINLPIYDIHKCKEKYIKSSGTVNETSMLCAGYDTGGKDTCIGDSGGPLAIMKQGKMTLIGVISWGEGCGVKGFPGVYTRISSYLDWIKSSSNTN